MYTVERGYEKKYGPNIITGVATFPDIDDAIAYAKDNKHAMPFAYITIDNKRFTVFTYYYCNNAWDELKEFLLQKEYKPSEETMSVEKLATQIKAVETAAIKFWTVA